MFLDVAQAEVMDLGRERLGLEGHELVSGIWKYFEDALTTAQVHACMNEQDRHF